MNTKETVNFLIKRKKENKITCGITAYVNQFAFDVSKARPRINKFCEEVNILGVEGQNIKIAIEETGFVKMRTEYFKMHYSYEKTLSLTKKEALEEYKRLIKEANERLEEAFKTKQKMLEKNLEKAGKKINGKNSTKKKKNN